MFLYVMSLFVSWKCLYFDVLSDTTMVIFTFLRLIILYLTYITFSPIIQCICLKIFIHIHLKSYQYYNFCLNHELNLEDSKEKGHSTVLPIFLLTVFFISYWYSRFCLLRLPFYLENSFRHFFRVSLLTKKLIYFNFIWEFSPMTQRVTVLW